jgi:competence protein ComEA
MWASSTGTLAAVGATALVGIAAFVLAFGSAGAGEIVLDGGQPVSGAPIATSASVGDGGEIVVEIVGAVVRPGVYHLPVGSRVDDLLAASGGFGPRVDTDRAALALNRAAILTDGIQIRVPSRDDVETAAPTGSSSGGKPATGSGLIDLNSATASELDTLPGIGPVTADKIITARDEARFAAVEDLRTRGIVGEKTFDGLKDLVTVR